MVATAPLMDVDGTDLPVATATGAEGGATGAEMAHIASRAPASAGKMVASRDIANGDQKKFTYIDRSGSFPGLGHCVDGILRAHLQARDANIRVAELSTYMLEYCEEDIATALGVSLAPAEGSAAAWDLATTPVQRENSAKEGEMTGTASQVMAALQHRLKEQPSAGLQQEQQQAPPAVVVVTRRHSVVRVPERGDSTKMKMVRRMCSRLSTLYTPKCCAEHKPCCSSEWRARFAQRSDALRYCYLVRDAVEGRFAQAMRRVNSEADALEERAQMPSSNKAQFTPVNPDCLAGGRKEFSLECGHLGDGSKLQTDGGRSLPSFREQGLRVEIMHEVEQRLLARSEIFKSLDSKLKEVLTLRNRKVKPATVDFELKFTTDGILDAADREDTTSVGASSLIEEIMSTKNSFGALPGTVARIKRAVATSLYRMRDDLVAVGSIERACPKSHPCEPYGTSVHGEGMVDHVAHVRLQFTGGNERALRVSKTLGTSIYTKTLQAALTKELPDKEGGGDYPVFAFASVTDVKIHVGEEQEPPAWYRAQLDAKVSAARQERNAAYECKLMAKQLVSLSRRKSDDSIEVAVLKESGKANQAQSLDDRIERCDFLCMFA